MAVATTSSARAAKLEIAINAADQKKSPLEPCSLVVPSWRACSGDRRVSVIWVRRRHGCGPLGRRVTAKSGRWRGPAGTGRRSGLIAKCGPEMC
jgi:hypothetical protein